MSKHALALLFLALPIITVIYSTMSEAAPPTKASEVEEVWTKKGWPPTDYPIPQGFRISPNGAYRAVAQSKLLSLKHNWVCFRDSDSYYIADTFGKSIDASNVVKYGIKVDGAKGQVK